MISKILCFIWGHHYFVIEERRYHRKIGCRLCPSEWGMCDEIKVLVQWDEELEEKK